MQWFVALPFASATGWANTPTVAVLGCSDTNFSFCNMTELEMYALDYKDLLIARSEAGELSNVVRGYLLFADL
ncbi:hypothetical protein PVAP13_6KG311112 [Panicum virgatum]|uniref:Carbonic anhydrase n=1 Tax=Panicum virgatum TaxID=38727 RepID=A0A8T0RIQ5_PANVG|nr:hypothetical protein PVAP13_6KG311112 [Panicum virgatum]